MTEPKAAISPMPWRLGKVGSVAIDILDANNELVCKVWINNPYIDLDKAKANADAIVSYVNSCAED